MNPAAVPDPHWTAYLTALLTPAIALGAAVVAGLQFYLARQKLKLDLFDRRLAVYAGVRKLLGEILRSGKADNEPIFEFLRDTAQAKWLFDDSVAAYFDELYRQGSKLHALQAETEARPRSPEHAKLLEKEHATFEWFTQQHAELDRRMEPFLRLGHGYVSWRRFLPWNSIRGRRLTPPV